MSGIIALTLSPMMCSVLLKNTEEGRFAKIVNRVFGAMTRWYGRKLDRSLDYKAITGLFAVTILGLVGFLYMHTSKELAPEEDQGIMFVQVQTPSGSTSQRTKEVIDEVTDYFLKTRGGILIGFRS